MRFLSLRSQQVLIQIKRQLNQIIHAYLNIMNKLHQLNISYSNREDRLLLRASTKDGDEYRLWLTRRFTRLLYDVLAKEMDKKGGVTAICSNEQTTKLFKNGAFEKPFKDDNVNLPLGESGIVAFSIKTGTDAEGTLTLELHAEDGRGINLSLNNSLLYLFYSLLTQGINQANWQLHAGKEITSQHIH